jgi:hypothetical protein
VFGWFIAIGADGLVSTTKGVKYWLIDDAGTWYRLLLEEKLLKPFGGLLALNGQWVKIKADVLASRALQVRTIKLEEPPHPSPQITFSAWFIDSLALGIESTGYWLVSDQGGQRRLLLDRQLMESFGEPAIIVGKRVKVLADVLTPIWLWVRSIELDQLAPLPPQLTVSGWFGIDWIDDFERGMAWREYWLQDDQGQSYRLLLDKKLTAPFGGPQALVGKRIRVVADVWAAPPQARWPMLWVRSIKLEESPALNFHWVGKHYEKTMDKLNQMDTYWSAFVAFALACNI